MARRRQKAPAKAVGRPPGPGWLTRSTIVAALLASLAGCRPVADASLWWNLARGRAAAGGEWAPSRSLLALDQAVEADWLSGLPLYGIYALLGAAGLMVARLAAALLVMEWARARLRASFRGAALVGAAGALAVMAPALDPGPRLWELLLLMAILHLAGTGWRAAEPWPWPGAWRVVVVVAAAANLAPRSVLLLLAALLGGLVSPRERLLGLPPRTPGPSNRGWAFPARSMLWAGLLVLASWGSPRGWATSWDSLRILAPWLAAPVWALEQAVQGPQWAGLPLRADAWLFGLISLTVAAKALRRGAPFRLLAAVAAAQAAAWSDPRNLPLAAVLVLGFADDLAEQEPEPRAAGPDRVAAAAPRLAWLSPAAAAAVLLWALPVQHLGWGVDQRLDPRFVQQACGGMAWDGTAWCDEELSAGLISWLAAPGLQAQDTPGRALLGGRLIEHRLLAEDLRHDRRHRYWREDATAGGWWLPLRERRTQAVLVAADDPALIAGLEPTLWKPLMLDAPVIVFAQAGDPVVSGRLAEVLQQRFFVESGPWAYSPPQSTGSPYDRDLGGVLADLGTPHLAVRQARVFAAMDLHVAAMRVLLYATARWPSDQSVAAQVLQQQTQLAHQERLRGGAVSGFRAAAWRQAVRDATRPPRLSEPLRRSLQDAAADAYLAVAASYLRGDLQRAMDQLDALPQEPETLYARGAIELEGGDPDAARRVWEQVTAAAPHRPLGRLAAERLELLVTGAAP